MRVAEQTTHRAGVGCMIALGVAAMALAGAALAEPLRRDAVLSATTTTAEVCAQTREAVWVVVEGKGDCIRYFAGGLDSHNPVAIAFFHGDLIHRGWNQAGQTTSESVLGYRDVTTEKMDELARTTSAELGVPFIWLGRPGAYGSSGDHRQRRRFREVALVNAALDAIKAHHAIDTLVVAGQSSGGHLVAATLATRTDIVCAVAGSGVIAVAERIRLHRWPADATGFTDFYDPIDHIGTISKDPRLRIFIVGDPHDANVPFASQRLYFERAKAAGLHAVLIEGSATGSEHHGLNATARRIAGWCAKGVSDDQILHDARDLKG
jgi:dienelactone hydrolase